MTLTELIKAARELAPEEKLILADELWEEGVEASEPAVDAEWRAEFRRRIADIDNGKVELVDGRETMRLARQRLAERRAGTNV
ncbi:MAG: addiction module protein [Ancrocorticia sp.]|uniref:addiction module protein n=1 Tax=Ancrocorticia sp. TaxID=2593684 RepID=UPI003F91E098